MRCRLKSAGQKSLNDNFAQDPRKTERTDCVNVNHTYYMRSVSYQKTHWIVINPETTSMQITSEQTSKIFAPPPPTTTTDQHSHIPHFDPVPSLTPLQSSLSKALPPLTMPLSAHGLFFGPHAFQNLAKHKTSLKKKKSKFSNLIFKNTDLRNWRNSAKFTSFFTTTQLLFIAPKLVSWTPPHSPQPTHLC